MSKFEQWWQKEEDLMRQQGADDEIILGAMRNIAEMAWNEALTTWAQCYCGDAYSAEKDLHSYIVIAETGYCPNCIAMGMSEYKK